MCFSKRNDCFSLFDKEAIALRLCASRVGCIHRLIVRGSMPGDGAQLLASRLASERIGIKMVEIHDSGSPEHTLQLAAQFGAECVKMSRSHEVIGHRALLHNIPYFIYHCSSILYRECSKRGLLGLLYTDGFSGRVVVRLETAQDYDCRQDVVEWFIPTAISYYQAATPLSSNRWTLPTPLPGSFQTMAKDFLLFHFAPEIEGDGKFKEVWTRELGGPPEESDVCMEEWWREAVREPSPVRSYYYLLKGCGWAVWRVRNSQMGRRHLRVMQRLRGGDPRVSLAVHFQLVTDA